MPLESTVIEITLDKYVGQGVDNVTRFFGMCSPCKMK